ncbi:uncharacterized protein LOC100205540 [Hydra vulgaris]|uniref:uncharacterized protein LOC100205540 n=1 Tax=Hydra vulgaris TaxID=6087 RepID=UPI0006412A2A|nr:uncharacterized protein LOC100205540 [Hydra vulgaris]XP_012555793.1 uncharacterized protein LOC100205540 [Hydra vulgaris]XP_047131715.1 uncharacterized protein LOC100205540 [Hydra vulgaris]
MEVDLKYVFSSDLILRCRYTNGHPIPIEVVDLVDILEKLKCCLKTQGSLRSRAVSDPGLKRKPFHILKNHILSPSCETLETRKQSLPRVHFEQTNSVILQMSPAMKLRRRKTLYPVTNEESSEDLETEDENFLNYSKNSSNRSEDDKRLDFVYISTFDRFDKAENFLQRVKNTKKTFSVEIDVGIDNQISISYQQLFNFDCEYMILKCFKTDSFVLIKPF